MSDAEDAHALPICIVGAGANDLRVDFLDPRHNGIISITAIQRSVMVDGRPCTLEVESLEDDDMFTHGTRVSLLKSARGLVLCFDVTERRSFARVETVVKSELKRVYDELPIPPILLCGRPPKGFTGTKDELARRREVPERDGLELAASCGAVYLDEADGLSVEETFTVLAKQIVHLGVLVNAPATTGRVHSGSVLGFLTSWKAEKKTTPNTTPTRTQDVSAAAAKAIERSRAVVAAAGAPGVVQAKKPAAAAAPPATSTPASTTTNNTTLAPIIPNDSQKTSRGPSPVMVPVVAPPPPMPYVPSNISGDPSSVSSSGRRAAPAGGVALVPIPTDFQPRSRGASPTPPSTSNTNGSLGAPALAPTSGKTSRDPSPNPRATLSPDPAAPKKPSRGPSPTRTTTTTTATKPATKPAPTPAATTTSLTPVAPTQKAPSRGPSPTRPAAGTGTNPPPKPAPPVAQPNSLKLQQPGAAAPAPTVFALYEDELLFLDSPKAPRLPPRASPNAVSPTPSTHASAGTPASKPAPSPAARPTTTTTHAPSAAATTATATTTSSTPPMAVKGNATPPTAPSTPQLSAATGQAPKTNTYAEDVPKSLAIAAKDHRQLAPLCSSLLERVHILAACVPVDRPRAKAGLDSWASDLAAAMVTCSGAVVTTVGHCFTALNAVIGVMTELYEAYKRVKLVNNMCADLVDRCTRLAVMFGEYALHLVNYPPKLSAATDALYAAVERALADANELVDKWSSKGKQTGWFKKLVGKISELATSRQYQEDFVNVNAKLTQCAQDLANDATFQTRMAMDVAADQRDERTAHDADMAGLQHSITVLVAENREFSDEMRAQWAAISSDLSAIGVNLAGISEHLGVVAADVRRIDENVKETKKLLKARAVEDSIQPHVIDWSLVEMEDKPFDQGGFGGVFRGKYNRDNVVIKILSRADGIPLSEKDRIRLLNEAQVQIRVCVGNAQRIVEVKGVVMSASHNRVGLVTELMHESLYDRLHRDKEDGPFPWEQALKWIYEAADGLARVHVHKVIHGDFKSHNILLTEEGHAKITDFGLSVDTRNMPTMMSTAAGPSAAASPGSTAGTPAWKAPELLTGGKHSLKTDIYAFAITAWEIATREVPLAGLVSDYGLLFTAVVANNVRPSLDMIPESYPDTFRVALARWWAPNPNLRPDMEGVVAELQEMRRAAGVV